MLLTVTSHRWFTLILLALAQLASLLKSEQKRYKNVEYLKKNVYITKYSEMC